MKSSSSLPRDCAGLAPQLTALFDGEADETQAQQARAHLLVCPECSRAWLNWTQYRATLQSEPVPAPPPTFLWRLLIAYRVAAFAHPARYPEALPTISAHDLRDIEAPLPPRLSQHILAQTTRKPNAHVMLTPLAGVTPTINARQKARTAKFRRFPQIAAPALALWILMLGRTDLIANFPVLPSDATLATRSLASSTGDGNDARNESLNSARFAPIPVLAGASATRAEKSQFAENSRAFDAQARPSAPLAGRAQPDSATRPAVVAPLSLRASNRAPNRASNAGQSDETLNRALLLALNAGRTDIVRAQNAPVAPLRVAAPLPAVAQKSPEAQASLPASTLAPKTRNSNVRSTSRANFDAEPSTGFVSLTAMTAPIGPVRTFTNARLRAAVFSEESAIHPRVSYANADGRRLARFSYDDGEVPLRVSRPNAGAPTLRSSNFAGDSGPRIEDLRSAVDDFRASVSGERSGDE